MRTIVLPQALSTILPSLGNQCNLMFKTTAFLSVIAVPELVHTADGLRSSNFTTLEPYAAFPSTTSSSAQCGHCFSGRSKVDFMDLEAGGFKTGR